MKDIIGLARIAFLSMCFVGFSQNQPLFDMIPSSKSGIDFNNEIIDDTEKNILIYSNFYGGAGVGVGDFNKDGLEDVFFAGNMFDDKLYFNLGDFKFEDVTINAGIVNGDGSWSTGVTVADVNADGYLDIYVTKELFDHKPELRKNKLYINQGDGTFIELAEQYGVADSERSRHAAFFDYNKDGYLDLLVLNQPPNPGSYSEFSGSKLLLPQFTSRLYKNNKGERFVDVTEESGLFHTGFPNAVSASDFNNDGWTDLYIAHDFYAPDALFINNQDGTFMNIVDNALNHMSYYSMGIDVADINNDGNLDAYVVDMVAEDNFRLKSNMSGMDPNAFWNVVNNGWHYQYMFNNFHLNNGNNTFSDIAQLTNTAATDWSWSPLIADFDNDGLRDIYVTNGLLRDIRNTDASKAVGDFVTQTATRWVKENPNGGEVTIWDILDLEKALGLLPSVKLSNFMFKNNGNFQFEKMANKWGLDTKGFSNGSAYADFDNDGDLDLVVNNINDEAFLYRNNSDNNYLRFELKSSQNQTTLGTRVTVSIGDDKQIIETTNVRGIYSTSEQIAHFGIGKNQIVNQVKIDWPNKTQTVLNNVPANQKLVIIMEDGVDVGIVDNLNKKEPLFTEITGTSDAISISHVENEFDDYEYQVLLPHKMSQFGPSLAVGDVNNDQLEDVYLGGAAGKPGSIFIQKVDGSFKSLKIQEFENDKLSEDIDALIFDVDLDGDNDLYVVSGGNEYEEASEHYRDRLYLNDGHGNFSKAEVNVGNPLSGSVVTANDFDQDGDLDLFIGGRLSPRNYPTPVSSRILENQNGKLVDITRKKASGLLNLGMVTDAIWTDYNGDSQTDLVVLGEWMPIIFFKNEGSKFLKQEIPELKDTEGWWFSIEQADFDGDGDYDYVAGNLGLNYKYKTSIEEPFDVYYEDFDGNGSNDIVLGYYNYGKHYPVRGFSCSSQQVPALKEKIKKYDLFASLEIQDIYGKKDLKEALYFNAKIFSSIFIENEGNGNFKIKTLPIEAQITNINDILIKDINNDNNLDLILVGNLFVSEIETPRNDAGIGTVLLGDGENNFSVIDNKDSGFFAKKDAKKIKLLKGKDKELVLVGNNDDILQVFKLNRPSY
jgi:hypothetical protein